MRNREGNYDDGIHRTCTKCGRLYRKTSKTVTYCNICNSERVKKRDIRKKIVARAKGRAKAKNLDFDINYLDIVIPTHCPILGIKLVENKGKSGAYRNSLSLDRIEPNKGYTKGNIQVISQLANGMKQNATKEELIKFAEWVMENYNPAKTNDLS